MKKGTIYFALPILLAVLGVVGLVVLLPRQSASITEEAGVSLEAFTDETYGLSLSYPSDALVGSLSESDKENKFILRFQKPTSPEYLVTVRAESGLRVAAQLGRVDVIDLVSEGALRSLPTRNPDYQLVSEKSLTLSGKPARQIEFTYTGPAGEKIKQYLVLIERDPDSAVYVAMQSRETDYDSIKSSVFDPIVASVNLR